MSTRPSLTIVRQLKAPPERVYSAWTEPAKMMRWWGPDSGPVLSAEADVRPGGRFRVIFQTEDGERHDGSGEYREVVHGERLVFTWQWITMPERQSLVTITLEPKAGGTELTLHHAQFADEKARDDHRGGWGRALDKLATFLSS